MIRDAEGPEGGLETGIKAVRVSYRSPSLLAIPAGENINWVARMLGHKSPVVTLERYNRFVPNLTREDGKALLEAGKIAKHFAQHEE
jgi:hypothetical protein